MQRSWQLIILIITAIVLWRFIVFIVNKYTKESMTQNSLYSIPMMTVNTAQHGNHKIPVHHIKGPLENYLPIYASQACNSSTSIR